MAEGMGQELEERTEDTLHGKYLSFILEDDHYGIEIKYVTEIIGIHTITAVPEMPQYIRGIINLRGKIIPVMDVRLRFGKSLRAYNDRTCIIVIHYKEVFVGLIVDSVSEVVAISTEEIVPPPDMMQDGPRYVMGIGKIGNEVRLLLDSHKLLHDGEVEPLKN